MAATDSTRTDRPGTRERRELEAGVAELIGKLMAAQRPHFMALCREFELFPPQLLVLRALDRPRPMREVAEHLACDSSNMTGITDRLEERGLVRRTADSKDRRVKLLVLTEDGERMRKEIVSRMSHPPEAIVGLPDRDLETLRRILGKALASD